MFDRVVSELVGEVEGVLAGLDPGSVPLREVESVWAAFDRIERLVAGAKLRLASRVEEAGSWRRAGRRSAADHLALLSGTSVGAARGALEASKHLEALPVVSQAVASGLLSASQATVITDAAAVAPQAQTDLVAAAGRESLSELRDRCGRAKAAADRDADARHRRIHAARFLRKRACADGAAELSYRSTPEEVAEVFAVAERLADRLFRRAHHDGRVEPAEAHLADGLLSMARRAAVAAPTAAAEPAPSGPTTSTVSTPAALPFDLVLTDRQAGAATPPGSSRGSPADGLGRIVPKEVIVRVDWDALVRGWPADGEVCEIPGVGAVPVSAVQAMVNAGDAVLKAVVTKGVDVVNVAHLGRRPSAFQRTGLRWLDLVCVEEGCGQRAFLEIDHTVPWTTSRITLLQLLEPRCKHHHRAKTRTDIADIARRRRAVPVPP
jgi:hypothetical protein